MLRQYISDIKADPMTYKTIVIDTADWAERLCEEAVCHKYGKTGIEDFGYGKGYTYVKEEFGRLLDGLSDLIEAGLNVVLTAHSIIRKFELPEETGAYDRYELKLGNKAGNQCAALAKEWADMVLFANYRQMVITSKDGKRKIQGGERVMYTLHNPCWDAKNRHGLPEELPFDFDAIRHCIPCGSTPEPATPQPKKQPPKEATPAPPEEPAKDTQKQLNPGIPKELADLMVANNVTEGDIQRAVAHKGYFPEDMPVREYPSDFVAGCLVAAFPQMLEVIKNLNDVPF